MATIQFSITVKYNGVRHEAHTPFEVLAEDLDALVSAGAFVISQPVQVANDEHEKVEEVKEEIVEEVKEEIVETKSRKAAKDKK